jgi:hypothetical protein
MSSWLNNKIRKPSILKQTIAVFVPTFHILIATGGRPCLQIMLDSLKDELTENDAITIVFDGEDALSKSTYSDDWLNNHKSKISIIQQVPNLGFYGHGIRNKYQGILNPKTTFIMNADDDDYYVAGTFNKLRRLCSASNTLYIAKFHKKSNNVIVPSILGQIVQNDIGTPCGIIPFDMADKSTWEYRYGGDFNYYNNLKTHVSKIEFLDLIIYIV